MAQTKTNYYSFYFPVNLSPAKCSIPRLTKKCSYRIEMRTFSLYFVIYQNPFIKILDWVFIFYKLLEGSIMLDLWSDFEFRKQIPNLDISCWKNNEQKISDRMKSVGRVFILFTPAPWSSIHHYYSKFKSNDKSLGTDSMPF